MRFRYVPLLAVLLAATAVAGEPPVIPRIQPLAVTTPATPPPAIKFPEAPPSPVPNPLPKPDPTAAQKLTSETLYVIQSDTPFLLFASPPDLVTITKESGPVKVRGKFVDGNGKNETRTFSAKNIAIVEASGIGRVELIAVPVGADGEAGGIRKAVDVTNGTAPQPPPQPDPIPPPKPKPVDPAPIPVDGFRVLIVYETADVTKLPQAQQTIMFAKQVRDYLDGHCTVGADGKTKEWRMWDQNIDATGDAKLWQDALARPRKSVPWIIISDGKTGFEGPLPATVNDTIALLKRFGG